METWWRDNLDRRPWWMNMMMLFCAYMTFLYMPWDFLLKPALHDQEMWFGILFRGVGAKITEPLHWAVYACGLYGFWRMKVWMWPWAALYVGQVAFSMFLYYVVYVGGFSGWLMGILLAVFFVLIAKALWDSQDQFGKRRPPLRDIYGEWALITGASSGIGTEFARALAREGLSCVLSARRKERLEELAKELEQAYSVQTKVITADLSKSTGAERLAGALEDTEISVLVNNAGLGYAGRFDKLNTAKLKGLIQVNCVAPVVLTSLLIQGMRERGHGAIILTSSIAGRQPLPLHSVYSASKSFDSRFGEALWCELRNDGIDVVTVEPGPVDTEFDEVAGEFERERGEPPADVVETTLAALGRQPSVVSGWFNFLRATILRLVPSTVTLFLAKSVVEKQTSPEMR